MTPMTPAAPPRRNRARLAAAAAFAVLALLPAAVALPGCSSGVPVFGALSRPYVKVQNSSTVPLQVTVWTARRGLAYDESWKDMDGRTERIDPGKSAEFTLREYDNAVDPIVRLQVDTRGPSFVESHQHWFELITEPSVTIRLSGRPEDIRIQSPTVRTVQIPRERVPSTGRHLATAAERPQPNQ